MCSHDEPGQRVTRFQRAIDTGNWTMIRAAAAELPRVRLGDALRICWPIRYTEPDVYPQACLRWVARFCEEAEGVELAELRTAVEAVVCAGGRQEPAAGA